MKQNFIKTIVLVLLVILSLSCEYETPESITHKNRSDATDKQEFSRTETNIFYAQYVIKNTLEFQITKDKITLALIVKGIELDG